MNKLQRPPGTLRQRAARLPPRCLPRKVKGARETWGNEKYGELEDPKRKIWGFTSFNVRQIDLCIKSIYIYTYIYIDLFSAEGNERANNRAMAGQQVKSRMIS